MQQNNDKKPGLSWSIPSQTTLKPPATSGAPASSTPAPAVQKSLPAAAGPAASSTSKYAGTLVVGIVVGVLIAWGYSAATNRGAVATDQTTITTNSTADKTQASDASASVASGVSIGTTGEMMSTELDLPSPQTAGLSVAIDKASVTSPTWVVVYDNVNGKPGNVLGAHLFSSPGSGTITLLRATVAGKTYFVGMSPDNRDRKYSKASDPATLASDGSVVLGTFVAK